MIKKNPTYTKAKEARNQAYEAYNKAFDMAERQYEATVKTAEAVHKAGMEAVRACVQADEHEGLINDYGDLIDKYNRGLVSTISAARRAFEATVDKLLVRYDDVRRECTE